MGKISKSFGGVCQKCNLRISKNYDNCLKCFEQFLFSTELKGSCPLCLSPRSKQYLDYDQCYDCYLQLNNDEYHLDGLIAISYEIQRDLGYCLHAYKGSGMRIKSYMAFPLQVLVAKWLTIHYDCIETAFNIDIDYIAHIPGHAGKLINTYLHSFQVKDDLIEEVNPHKRYSTNEGERKFDPDRFKVNNSYNVKSANILLFDDVYTTGSTIHSAASSLKEAGSNKVIGLVLAKHVGNSDLIKQVLKNIKDFDIDYCLYCQPY